jgi:preprotein translocase subunit YajC
MKRGEILITYVHKATIVGPLGENAGYEPIPAPTTETPATSATSAASAESVVEPKKVSDATGKTAVGIPAEGRISSGSEQNGGGLLSGPFLLFGAIILIFYFLIMRPDSKRRKEREKRLSALKVKDRVYTLSGIIGTIMEINADEITLLIDPKKDVRLRVLRNAVEAKLDEANEKK